MGKTCILINVFEVNVRYDHGHLENGFISTSLSNGVIMPIYQSRTTPTPARTILFILLMNLRDLNFQSSG